MAKTRSSRSSSKSGRGTTVALVVIAILLGLGWHYRAPAQGYANVSTAYMARVACSCRFVAGRGLEDCAKDRLEGMELVTLAEDVERKSVTARFPLLASDTAIYRKGYGCVLQEWEG
jgi:hypothetical protein